MNWSKTCAALLGSLLCAHSGLAQGPADAPAEAQGAVEADEAQLGPEERALVRLIKVAERAAYEHSEVARYLQVFSPDARVVLARQEPPHASDRAYDFEAWSQLQQRGAQALPHRQNRLMFRAPKVQIREDEATVRLDMRQTFFGGERVLQTAYTLRRAPQAKGAPVWQVHAMRQWPLAENVQGIPSDFDAAHWAQRDGKIDEPIEAFGPRARAVRLIYAMRYQEARDALKALTEQEPQDAETWLLLSQIEAELGEFKAAKASFLEARKRDAQVEVPPLLKVDFQTKTRGAGRKK